MRFSLPSPLRPVPPILVRDRSMSPILGVPTAPQRQMYHIDSCGGLMNANAKKQFTSQKHSPHVVRSPKNQATHVVVSGSSFMPRYSHCQEILKAYTK